MNKLLVSVAAAALLAPLSAQADDHADKMKSKMKASYEQSETALEAAKVVRFDTAMISAKELLGEAVYGDDDERLARVDDIVLSETGQAEQVVFLHGGLFGFAGFKGSLDYEDIDLSMATNYEPIVRIGLNEDSVEAAREFKADGMNDYSLASELIGAKVNLTGDEDNDDTVVISDIIMTKGGMARHLIVQETVVSSIGAGQKYAVDFGKLTIEQGDGGLILDLTEDALEASPRYDNWETASANSWNSPEWTDGDMTPAEDIKDAAEMTGETVEETAETSWTKTKDAASDAGETVENAAEKTWDKTKDAADATGDAIEDAADAVSDAAEDAADATADAADDVDDNT